MNNQLVHQLRQWHPQRNARQWVLGTVYRTEGPCYRKAGAMMLFNDLGQQFGMLSGGCLESDIQQQARRVMQSGRAVKLRYDGSDEDDLAFRLGIGCGGTVHILLQPVTPENGFLQLDRVLQALDRRGSGVYRQRIPTARGEVECRFEDLNTADRAVGDRHSELCDEGDASWLRTVIVPPPHLLVIGGGIDARPLVTLAHELGWQTSLWDPRPANARREFFMTADRIIDAAVETLPAYCREQAVDAAVLMSHNVGLDAAALRVLQDSPLRYLALLGPRNRRERVFDEAGVADERLTTPVSGPAGLDIGAELPESIALAILAECHARLQRRDGRPLSLGPSTGPQHSTSRSPVTSEQQDRT
ncbi:xanthine and CO dehydrogenase family maturation factor XdhC/CoxF family protein [Marinobacterium nitratireducens]|uniref:Xanthine and CO dehydrogenase family maturation factor XdhC/CoxF family protein n=1 Tax=Marinobacterium nitratireducens TaxID=518897 RepID=A0A917ZB25_9GAMM|nr:XdhC/CoxI family protein [Marinobacterium nitratireducens]GGO79069.1 xanthine and CO dehydrogenase family maturation factor XdhC/CoxF family protein [Marinobacterium nitratireducens]